MKRTALLILLAGLFLTGSLHAQSAGNCDPDSLEEYTTSGIVITQTTGNHVHYFLDEDMDGTEDLILNFGPWWYTPKEGTATRPNDGDTVAVEGGLNTTNPGPLPVLIVYEIDGEFWRNPYDPFWNDFNNHYNSNSQGNGYASGWIDVPVTEVVLSGTAIVDTTFIYNKYFLDVNSDDSADYHLNFGPYWYEPVSDIDLPEHGDPIEVEGWLIDKTGIPCVIVLVLNNSIWRDTSGIGPKVGEWIHEQMATQTRFRAFWDSLSHITVQPGWHSTGLPDSLYMQMIQVMVQNMPKYENQNGFAGFEIGMFNHNRQNHMKQSMWQMTFNNAISFQFHYNHQLEQRYRLHEETLALKRWRQQSQTWELVSGITADTIQNLVSFSDSEVSGFYLLSAEMSTGTHDVEGLYGVEIDIYPNPATDMTYVHISSDRPTTLSIDMLDLSGRSWGAVVSQEYVGESVIVPVNMGNLPSGIYLLRVKHDDTQVIRKIICINN